MHETFSADRHFQLWMYTVSHRQILLRSAKSAKHSTRLDVLFKDVSLVCLETSFEGLLIEEMDPLTFDLPIIGHQIPPNRKLFSLATQTSRGYIVAADFATTEDEGEYGKVSTLVDNKHLL